MRYIIRYFHWRKEQSYHLEELYKSFWRAYKKAFSSPAVTCHEEAIEAAINSPSPRFWISTSEASRQISRLEQGLPVTYKSKGYTNKREIIAEVYKRYQDLKGKRQFKGMSVRFITTFAVASPAPKFFISKRTARRIIDCFRHQQKAKKNEKH